MFSSSVPEVEYVDPWTGSFEDRLAALRKGSSRIAYFYEKPDTSTFRYRVYNMIQALATSNADVSAAYFLQCEMDRMDQVIAMADVLVVCRSRYTDQINRMITRAKDLGRRVLFDVDDLIFDPDYVHLILNTLDQPLSEAAWDFWFACIARLGATLRLCDGVIVTNEYLASRVREYADRQTYVIPNFLNEQQISLSARIFNTKKETGFARDERVHLGYFSGTPTHNKDFEVIAGTLARVMDRDPRLVLRIVGFLDLKGWLQEHSSRVEFHPLQDFLNLQRLIGSTEINLVPLQDNIFTNCKSELKYFEAGIVGTVTIASPTFTFRKAIADGDNGYVANAHEWEEKLLFVIDNLDSYADTARRAFEHSVERYSWSNQSTLIEKTILGFDSPSDRSAEPKLEIRGADALDRNQKLLMHINKCMRILEIGPSFSPIVPRSAGWNSWSVDHADQDSLKEKYRADPSVDIDRIGSVDFVCTAGNLDEAIPAEYHTTFDACIASHVVEHMPNPIGFFRSLEKILSSDGIISLAVPDKRHCFDYLKPLSMTSDVLYADVHSRTNHSKITAFNELAYDIYANNQSVWMKSSVNEIRFVHSIFDAKRQFDSMDERSSAPYVDYHGWVYTPSSFQLVMLELNFLGALDWVVESILPSVGVEFFVSLRRGRVRYSESEINAKRLDLFKRILSEIRDQCNSFAGSITRGEGFPNLRCSSWRG